LVLFFLTATVSFHGQTGQPLSLVDTIPMPNVKGRLDHLYVDVGNKRLFVAGLENGSVEVVDLKTGKWLRTMPGFQKPQGILFVPRLDKVFVASGDDGMVRVYSAKLCLRSAASTSKPSRPGSITSRTIRSKMRLLARKNPSSPGLCENDFVALGLQSFPQGLTDLWFVFDDKESHVSTFLPV
jgi:WD40 repeat protein